MNSIKLLTALSICLLSFLLVINCTAQDCEQRINIFFDFDKDIVKQNFEKELLTEIKEIGLDNIVSVSMSGHTDSKGSKAYNVDLANRRNSNVKKVLPNGVLSKLKVSAHGELKPFEKADYEDDLRIQSNRRVEVLISYHCGGVETSTEHLTQLQKDQKMLDEFIQSYAPEIHKVTFSNNEQQQIETAKGTLVIIPAGAFVRKDGSVPDEVNLEVKEYYDLMAILSEGLTTRATDGSQLETAGMVHLNATDENGNELQLAQSLVIAVPYSNAEGRKEGMQLYDANVNKQGDIEWQLSQVPDYKNPAAIDKNVKLNQKVTYSIDTAGLNIFEKQMALKALASLSGENAPTVTDLTVDTSAINSSSELKRYFFNVTNMGYVNCDRSALRGMGGKSIDVVMQRDEDYKGAEMTVLVFTAINSLAEPDYTITPSDKAIFSRIPEGLDVILISLVVKNEAMFLSKQAFKTSAEVVYPSFKTVTEKEYKKQVEGLVEL